MDIAGSKETAHRQPHAVADPDESRGLDIPYGSGLDSQSAQGGRLFFSAFAPL
jgi:hypothetical protein